MYPEYKDALTQDMHARGMTLREYAGWVGKMPTSELYVYRDRAGKEGGQPYDLYDGWLRIRTAVTETQFFENGMWFG